MSNKQKYYRTLITVEVLSDFPYSVLDLSQVDYDIKFGEVSGQISEQCEEITRDEMEQALIKQGSDPDFIFCGE
jgi:hypothetical protein